MNISGVLVHANPIKIDAIRQSLVEFDGVEIHGESDDGRLVVTIEDIGDQQAADTMLAVHRLEGVLSATLVYHNFESEEAEEPEADSTHSLSHDQ
jgi:periplasmic nitrate reductase NapD